MSHQVNFFADDDDASTLYSAVLKRFSSAAILADGKQRCGITPLSSSAGGELFYNSERAWLIPQWGIEEVERHFTKSDVFGQRISARNIPAFEYTRSAYSGDGAALKTGRMYWAFKGLRGSTASREVDTLFAFIRDTSTPLPFDERFRIFEHAAHGANYLDYGFDIRRPNPFREMADPG